MDIKNKWIQRLVAKKGHVLYIQGFSVTYDL